MGRYIKVSTKVKRELVEEARELNINISEVMRRALGEEVSRRRLRRLEERLKKKRDILDKIDIDEMVRLIREDREAI